MGELVRSHCRVPVPVAYAMLLTMDQGLTSGIGTLVVSGAVFLAGVYGVRSGRNVSLWTAVLAVSGAGLTAGALLVQHDPGLASWLIAPPVGAALGVANVRWLFRPEG